MRRNSICTKYCVQVLLFIFALTFGVSVQAVIKPSERDALIAFYDATGGDGWANTTNKWKKADGVNFNDAGTECSWFGVTCADLGGGEHAVIKLDLASNGLTGYLPAEGGNPANPALNDLTHLEELLLGTNLITGDIPADIGDLTSLTVLSLYTNLFSGTIPTSLGSLTSLTSLSLAENDLTGSIPSQLGALTSLTVLSLHNNHLEGSIPVEFAALTGLDVLLLQSNKLTGSIPGGLTSLTSLDFTWLDIRFNGLHTDDGTLKTFLNSKQGGGDFEATQTIDADGVVTTSVGLTEVDLGWNPAAYIQAGGYRVYLSSQPDTDFTLKQEVIDKGSTGITVSSLIGCTVYYSRVHSYTEPHANNFNEVESDGQVGDTLQFMTTGSGGCSPVIISGPGSYTLAENVAVGAGVTIITALDSDSGILTYSIIAGNDSGDFAIDANSGAITIASALDFETTPGYSLTVMASDGVNDSATETVTVNVTNINDNTPAITGGTGDFSIAENLAQGETITSIIATDLDGDTLTYSIPAGNESGTFGISGTGVITLAKALDFETPPTSYDLTIMVSDGPTSVTGNVTVNVTGFDEAPSLTGGMGTFSRAENVAVGDVITTLTASDPEGTAPIFSIKAGNNSGHFAINAASGAITLAKALDFESTTSYTLTVMASDGFNESATETVTVNVTDVDESSTGTDTAAAGGGGGGCSIRPDAEFDPTLLFWICLSVVYLMRKRPVMINKLAA